MSRMRSMPLSNAMSTRLTRFTLVRRRPVGCQTKASAPAKSGTAGVVGASRSSASAIRASTVSSGEVSIFVAFGMAGLSLAPLA
jgi:hypothetical protein